MTTKLTIEVDEQDRDAILRAVTKYQVVHHRAFGEVILPDGEGDVRGRILGEICRDWCELIDAARRD